MACSRRRLEHSLLLCILLLAATAAGCSACEAKPALAPPDIEHASVDASFDDDADLDQQDAGADEDEPVEDDASAGDASVSLDDAADDAGLYDDAKVDPDVSPADAASASDDARLDAAQVADDGGRDDAASPCGDPCSADAAPKEPAFAADVQFNLGFPPSAGRVTLSLNRAALRALIPVAEQSAIVVRNVDLTLPVRDGIAALKSACGTDWQRDLASPAYDCALTALGQTFRGPDGSWRSSGDFALVRALTMTPANAVVDGTSLANLKSIVESLSIGGGVAQLLADTFGIARTREILPSAEAQESILRGFVASHPAATTRALTLSLYDLLNDLTTWGTRYGPISGGHAGLFAPATPPRAVLLGPSFALSVAGSSNLRNFRGIDLSASAAGTLARLQAPSGHQVREGVAWSLTAAEATISGVAATSNVSPQLRILENPSFVRVCGAGDTCRSNLPTRFLAGSIWSLPQYQLEGVLADASYRGFATRQNYFRGYVCVSGACGAEVKVGYAGQPAGWTEYWTAFGIGSPPIAQYLWESAVELAQVALHRIAAAGQTSFLAEGQANANLPLSLDVHVTPEQVVASLLSALADKTAALDQRALGDYAASNADVDLFAARGDDGRAYLAFVSPDDPRPVSAYSYLKPGFFAEPSLHSELSTRLVLHAGEPEHHALALEPGAARTLYMRDAAGDLYRLIATLSVTGDTVGVLAAKAAEP